MCHHHELITKEGRPVCLEQGHCAKDSHCAPPAMLPFVFCNKHPGRWIFENPIEMLLLLIIR